MSLESYSYHRFFAELAVGYVDVGVDVAGVRMMLNKDHHYLHPLENYYYL